MSVARPTDAYSGKVTLTLEFRDGGTLPGQNSDMNVQGTEIGNSVELTH